ncbi:MAG: adenosylmethionine decarboxylase [Actinomycetota bacterium]|nr:adenosylmethionine decarboxylase [Actinomycetota bacterium]
MICATYDLIDCATPEPEPHELLDAIRAAVTRLGATILGELPVLFQPHGITCVLVLAESHLVVSTWPEHQFAHIDLFTCRADTDPEHALQPIIEVLGSRKVHGQRIHRVTPTSFSSETSQVSPSSAVAFDRRTGCAPS